MGFLQTAEVALGDLVVLALLGILFLWVRRQVIAGAQPLLMCALRANAAQPWRLGLLRLGPTTLEWFSVVGPSTKPGRSWPRADLLFGTATPTTEVIPGLVEALTIVGRTGAGEFELAMGRDAQTATRSWIESAPPGFQTLT